MPGTEVLTSSEVTAVLDHQTAVMEQMAAGVSMADVLESVVRALEDLMPGTNCSILLLDEQGALRHGAAPTLPPAYSASIDGLLPGPAAGSCGTAVYLGKSVVAADVTTDPHWEGYRHLTAPYGLRACWSSPIRCRERIVGTFAVYHDAPYEPDRRDEELLRRFTHLASLAVEHGRAAIEREARHRAEMAQLAAEEANRAKSQFVTALSHELRTPLQAITGFTENLQTLELSEQQRADALVQISQAAAHILDIVDDVLDLARVEAGAMPVDMSEVDVHAVIRESTDMLQPLAERRGVSLAHRSIPAVAWADRRRLQQVLLNLMSNAVRYSRRAGNVRVTTEADDDRVVIHVIDDGPGIPDEVLDRIFVPFDRLGADAGREGGAGLGLVLARRLSELMGGRLDLTSVVGQGTHVTVSLPARRPAD